MGAGRNGRESAAGCPPGHGHAIRSVRAALGCNLGNVLRTLATPDAIETSLRERLVKTGARLVRHARQAMFKFAEAALPLQVFAGMLSLIDGLRRLPGEVACA